MEENKDELNPEPEEKETVVEEKQEINPSPGKTMDKDTRLMLALCHLRGFIGFVLPFGNVIAPLVLWILKKDDVPELDVYGKEVLNYQITFSIALVIAFLSCFIFIGFVLLPIICIANIVFILSATIKVNEGKFYSYPFKITFIK